MNKAPASSPPSLATKTLSLMCGADHSATQRPPESLRVSEAFATTTLPENSPADQRKKLTAPPSLLRIGSFRPAQLLAKTLPRISGAAPRSLATAPPRPHSVVFA